MLKVNRVLRNFIRTSITKNFGISIEQTREIIVYIQLTCLIACR